MNFVFPIVVVAGIAIALLLGVIIAKTFRKVVEPNEVHIVQSRKTAKSYGKGSDNGNSYWNWPDWIPIIGVQSVVLPLSVFDLDLPNYEAYDVGKVPFVVDIKAFFRINDSNLAAERVQNLVELKEQLLAILQGTVRKVLAYHDIEEIMMERSKFGELFTNETAENLSEWGVTNVKNIELMDVRDSRDSQTVSNIMAKKESLIEKESRIEVAENRKLARQKEIEAQREVDVSAQEAEQKVGERTAEKEKNVGIANEQAQQEIKAQARITAEKDMEVIRVREVKNAEIERDREVVNAEQDKKTFIIRADGKKQETILVAEGNLKSKKLEAEGILAEGTSVAEAKRLAEMAVVSPQIALAEEIGENEGYQTYLVDIREVEKDETVGVEQAKALQRSDIKVITNAGSPAEGLDKVMDLFSSKGGTAAGAALEGLANTPAGQALLAKLGLQIAE